MTSQAMSSHNGKESIASLFGDPIHKLLDFAK